MKHAMLHIGIKAPSDCQADTKTSGYPPIMFFIGKSKKKVQLLRDKKDDTNFYQGIGLPCKIDQGFCDPTTRTKATIVWFTQDTCTTFQVAGLIKIRKK